MIIRNVVANWLFINKPDENGKYRLQFIVDEKQKSELETKMIEVAHNNGVKDVSKLNWWGSYKEDDEGNDTFGCKANSNFVSKKGENIEFILPVYDKRAQKMDEVPSIANGATINVEVNPYYVEYKGKKGVMLGLRSVQLLKYEEYSRENPYSNECEDEDDTPWKNEDSVSKHNSNDVEEDIFQ